MRKYITKLAEAILSGKNLDEIFHQKIENAINMLLMKYFFLKEPHRIHLTSILSHFKMQMAAGRVPCIAYQRNHFPLLHLLSLCHKDSQAVGIQGFIGFIVLDFNIISVAFSPWIMALTSTTIPSAADRMGVASGAAMSVPEWKEVCPVMGSSRYPKGEVMV